MRLFLKARVHELQVVVVVAFDGERCEVGAVVDDRRGQRRTTDDDVCGEHGVREDIERGQVLSKPSSITPHTKFKSEVYCLKKEEGGRHTPFFNGYRPQFYFRTTDVTGVANLPEGTEMVMPGDNVEMTIELIQPIAMDQGLRFAIREGGRTVGSGVVTEVVE